jgi:hypothetical protein
MTAFDRLIHVTSTSTLNFNFNSNTHKPYMILKALNVLYKAGMLHQRAGGAYYPPRAPRVFSLPAGISRGPALVRIRNRTADTRGYPCYPRFSAENSEKIQDIFGKNSNSIDCFSTKIRKSMGNHCFCSYFSAKSRHFGRNLEDFGSFSRTSAGTGSKQGC